MKIGRALAIEPLELWLLYPYQLGKTPVGGVSVAESIALRGTRHATM